MYQMSYEKFLDKVHGGWYGKCLGGAAGAPVEGVKGVQVFLCKEHSVVSVCGRIVVFCVPLSDRC